MEGELRRVTGHAPLPDGGQLASGLRARRRAALLLHGLSAGPWPLGTFREALSGRFRVVSFDPGAWGNQQREALTTTRSMAADAVALLDHLDIETAHVFGYARGHGGDAADQRSTLSRIAKLISASRRTRESPSRGGRPARARPSRAASPIGTTSRRASRGACSRALHERRATTCAGSRRLITRAARPRARTLQLVAGGGRAHDAAPTSTGSRARRLAPRVPGLIPPCGSRVAAGRPRPPHPGNAIFDVNKNPSGHDMSRKKPVDRRPRWQSQFY
jgi:pimeloyl-ACP methyl ester carboxylesterase